MSAVIRCAVEADAAQVQAIYEPVVTHTAHSFEIEPPGVAEMRRRIGETLLTLPWLVCERDGNLLGYAYAGPHRRRQAYGWSVDFAVYVHANAQRRGVGQALYVSLAAIVRHQGYFNAYAGIALPNDGSIKLHQSLGFRSIGVYPAVGFKNGAWHDVSWWHLKLREPTEPPQPPLPLADVRDSAAWPELMSTGLESLKA